MLTKHAITITLALAALCLIAAGLLYPGGSPIDPQSVGFDWTKNYISNLLEYKALNGMDNTARPLGVAGVVIMGMASGWAFVRFARKSSVPKISVVIQYLGILLIVFSALVTIPALHDRTVQISSIFTLLLFFYVTALLLMSRLTTFKVLSVVFLASFYGAAYLYFSQTGLEYLPLVQKVTHLVQIGWILGLEYLTKAADFAHINAPKTSSSPN